MASPGSARCALSLRPAPRPRRRRRSTTVPLGSWVSSSGHLPVPMRLGVRLRPRTAPLVRAGVIGDYSCPPSLLSSLPLHQCGNAALPAPRAGVIGDSCCPPILCLPRFRSTARNAVCLAQVWPASKERLKLTLCLCLCDGACVARSQGASLASAPLPPSLVSSLPLHRCGDATLPAPRAGVVGVQGAAQAQAGREDRRHAVGARARARRPPGAAAQGAQVGGRRGQLGRALLRRAREGGRGVRVVWVGAEVNWGMRFSGERGREGRGAAAFACREGPFRSARFCSEGAAALPARVNGSCAVPWPAWCVLGFV